MRLSNRDFRLACRRRQQSVSWEKITAELCFKGSVDELEALVKEMRRNARMARKAVAMPLPPSAVKAPPIVTEVDGGGLEEEAPSIVARICGDPTPRKSALARRGGLRPIEHDPLDDLKHPLVFRSGV